MVGRLSARVDLSMLEAVADDGWSLLLVGPRQGDFEPDRVDRLVARPNVCWVGPKRFDELPSYLRVIDVGLTPYADTEFNRASSPLKALEYLAAGRASVASDLPATRLLTDHHVQVASDPTSFAGEVRAALGRPRTTELSAQRRAVARSNSWTSRAHQFLAQDVPRENQVTTT
jgi:teichuronic acid biosynthesis glycosyltransferase TuaH